MPTPVNQRGHQADCRAFAVQIPTFSQRVFASTPLRSTAQCQTDSIFPEWVRCNRGCQNGDRRDQRGFWDTRFFDPTSVMK